MHEQLLQTVDEDVGQMSGHFVLACHIACKMPWVWSGETLIPDFVRGSGPSGDVTLHFSKVKAAAKWHSSLGDPLPGSSECGNLWVCS